MLFPLHSGFASLRAGQGDLPLTGGLEHFHVVTWNVFLIEACFEKWLVSYSHSSCFSYVFGKLGFFCTVF